MPVRWYHGTFRLDQRCLRLPTAAGCPALLLRLDRVVPFPADTVRSVTLLFDQGRLWVQVTAEVPVAAYPGGAQPDPDRVAGVDLGVIHPYAVAAVMGRGCWCRGGRSALNTACTWPTPKPAAGRLRPGHLRGVSGGRGAGVRPAAGQGWSRAGIVAGSGRPGTRPRKP
jgi:hypothetical protein